MYLDKSHLIIIIYMTFITFIYKIGKHSYFGKYCCDYLSDDHEGLDNEIQPVLILGLNEYRKQNNMPKLISEPRIGVLSFSASKDVPIFSTSKEIKSFDFYRDYEKNVYINGNKILI
jgi:hypothetical protein